MNMLTSELYHQHVSVSCAKVHDILYILRLGRGYVSGYDASIYARLRSP